MNEKHQTGVLFLLRQRLDDLGLQPAIDTLLAPGSPLAIVGAQTLYLVEPLLSAFIPGAEIMALASHLEDGPEETD